MKSPQQSKQNLKADNLDHRSDLKNDIRGRGASSNVTPRFEKLTMELDFSERHQDIAGEESGEKPLLRTQFFKDSSKSVVSENSSPDIGFRFSVNPYRGCEHGCAYCYARPTHEYLGYSAGLDFESKIFVKEDAPKLLREKLMSRSWRPETIAMSGVTDCYQPIERKLQLTRQCLEVLLEFKNPVGIITKNKLVTRDLDLLSKFAKFDGAMVYLSITSLDAKLIEALEPRTSRPEARLAAIRELSAAGVPVGVNIAPVIPGLTDHEIPAILKAAREAGATHAGYVPVRLPLSVTPLFSEWLEVHRPEKKDKVLELIRSLRGGKLNDPRFGTRMKGEGAIASNLEQMFRIYSRREGLNEKEFRLSADHFQKPDPGRQLSLF